jgi:thiosulfate reductase cytochrome b subunit
MESSRRYRHSLITRLTHGAFGVAFMGLALTGAQIYLHAHWLPGVGSVHQTLALVAIASGIIYFAYAALSGSLRKLLLSQSDVSGLVPMALYYVRLRNTPPAYVDYNPLQKLAYTIVLLTMGPLIAATGLAIWPHLPLLRPLQAMFGGRRAASVWHVGFAVELVLFFFGHMVMIATTGLRENLHAIVIGRTPVPPPTTLFDADNAHHPVVFMEEHVAMEHKRPAWHMAKIEQ